MTDPIERQDAIDALDCISGVEEVLRSLPSAQSDVARDIATIIENEQDMRVILNSQSETDISTFPSGVYQVNLREFIVKESTAPFLKGQKIMGELIRCKDCMYWVSHDKRCVYLNHGFAPNMWCCHAERRTDG